MAIQSAQSATDGPDGLSHRRSNQEVVDACYAILAENPLDANACRDLVRSYGLLGRPADAAGAWLMLAEVFANELRLDEAIDACHEALALNPDSLVGLLALGRLYLAIGQENEAIRLFEAALAVDPDYSDAHIQIGIASHTCGAFARAWEQFRWYFPSHRIKERVSENGLWDGAPLEGRTILLWAEQGLGDTIQFLRYVDPVRRRGGRVIVECDRRLESLVQRMSGVAQTTARGAPRPIFDVHAPLLLVPALLQANRPECRVPYLSVDKRLMNYWRQRLAPVGEQTIGLSWGGKSTSATARDRFVRLAAFAPLASLPKTRFVSLQVGPWTADLVAPPPGLHIEHLQTEHCSLADTAALIQALDLVITVDTMIAHLAGALAKPVWTLLPRRSDWRWERGQDTSVWFPTMRLFRQGEADTWSDVLTRVRTKLVMDSRTS